MSIPKKKKGEWKIGGRAGQKAFDYHEDSVRNRVKRHYENIIKRVGKPITQRVKEGIKGTKAPTPLTKRHNIKR